MLSLASSLPGTPPLSYQWRKDGIPLADGDFVSGAQDAALHLAAVSPEDAGKYSVVIQNIAGSVTSTNALLTVIVPPVITAALQSQTVGAGSNVVFSVETSGSIPFVYRWFKGATPLAEGGKISGTAGSSLTISGLSQVDAGEYSVIVSNFAGSVSCPASLTVIDPPVFVSQAASRSIGLGTNVVFQVEVAGTEPLEFQWFKGAELVNDDERIAGSRSDTLSFAGVVDADAASYTVRVSNFAGKATCAPAVLTVLDPPVITLQPTNQTNVTGGTVTFAVEAAGTAPLQYQWQMDGADLFGQTNSSLTLSNLSDADLGSYMATVSNAAGTTNSASVMLVIGHLPVITTPPAGQAIVPGRTARFTVGVNGLTPFRYQWQKDEVNLVGKTNRDCIISNVSAQDAGGYTVVISNLFGSVTSAPPAFLSLIDAPVITEHPMSQTNRAGTRAQFNVVATGTDPAYLWRKNGAAMIGQTNATLVLDEITANDAGEYTIIVSNPAGTAASLPAHLLLVGSAAITAQPLSQTNNAGSIAAFTVVAESPVELTYQWIKDDTQCSCRLYQYQWLDQLHPGHQQPSFRRCWQLQRRRERSWRLGHQLKCSPGSD